MRGRIVKSVAGEYLIELDGELIVCTARGSFRHREITPLVGDMAEFERGGDRGVITALSQRKNAFIRPPVANLDAMVIVASLAIPVTEPFLIDRMAAIAHKSGCEPIICVNKNDLSSALPLYRLYSRAGYQVFAVSAETGEGTDELAHALRGKISA
ncbi:MAG: GTPase RsgA, partial [Oscillospiraceae bacterium]|nr:GTPase RsgA [Oscillospiraceae bacterium]